MVSEAIPRTMCEETIRHEATEFSWRAIRCSQTVAVVTWQDERGVKHSACPRHIGTVQHRYPDVSASHETHAYTERPSGCGLCVTEAERAASR